MRPDRSNTIARVEVVRLPEIAARVAERDGAGPFGQRRSQHPAERAKGVLGQRLDRNFADGLFLGFHSMPQ